MKGFNKAPKPLRDSEPLFNSKIIDFESIDYIELVEKTGDVSSINTTLNNNNFFILNDNSIQNDDNKERNLL